jgi:pimeloyl-ACP methyl ester carboxylesterase
MSIRTIETQKGIRSEVREAGDGQPVLYLHGAGGLLRQEPLIERLAERYHVYAPVWPGYGDDPTEDLIEDMLDFTLHGWDVVEALELERPHLIGHSMGGMIATEMAAVNPRGLDRLVLIDPAGLWLEERPIPDIFAMLPFQLPGVLFSDPAKGEAILTGGVDFSDSRALTDFMVGNARRLGTAGKILFPIPNRRLSKRLYRLANPTLVIWGADDRLIDPAYADRWLDLLPQATKALIAEAGHMAPYEQPEAVATAIAAFLG